MIREDLIAQTERASKQISDEFIDRGYITDGEESILLMLCAVLNNQVLIMNELNKQSIVIKDVALSLG